jgi:nucleotide-binding universal stress UspA family protein
MYAKIALAVAFSPRMEALLIEAARLVNLFEGKAVLIHVGAKTDEKLAALAKALREAGFADYQHEIVWENGDPVKRILAVCRKKRVNLLIAGALKKENIFRYYIGGVARKILRKAPCPVLVLTEPSEKPKPFKYLVIHAGDKRDAQLTIETGCAWGKLERARQLHVVKEIKMYGLTMALAGEDPEHEYSETRRTIVQEEIAEVQKVIDRSNCGDLKINIKIAAGKSGYELGKFAQNAEADLLITEAPRRALNIFDRMFPHDLEYILADLPCNLLIIPGH